MQSCEWAIGQLGLIPGLSLVAYSQWYVSASIPAGQPPYINGVARLDGTAEPRALLARLHEIEAGGGRQRSLPNASRTLDLDLIELDGLVSPGPALILPHPRAHLRGFVLLPIRDVAPDWVHPTLGETASALAAHLPPQEISLLALA